MIETMPDDLFKFLEANPENWGLHERLDPCLDFNELGWDSMFGWNLGLGLGFDLDLEYYLDSEMGHYLDYEMGYYLDLDFYYYLDLDIDLDFFIEYLTELCIKCGVLE